MSLLLVLEHFLPVFQEDRPVVRNSVDSDYISKQLFLFIICYLISRSEWSEGIILFHFISKGACSRNRDEGLPLLW